MRKLYLYIPLIIFCLGLQDVFSKSPSPNEKIIHSLLVQFKDQDGLAALKKENYVWIKNIEPTIEPYLIYKINLHLHLIDVPKALYNISTLPYIQVVQTNKPLYKRQIPNDSLFSLQWNMDYIKAELAWDISTGGVNSLGDTIVVAIIDDGITAEHPDLTANVWINEKEIPNDGIDNDSNGYIDDYKGWNTVLNDDQIFDPTEKGAHGTPIAGIIGAVGNNSIGVAGLNWNVKLMVIVGGINTGQGFEDNALKSYFYALTHKKNYIHSNGQKGAYVVSTNSSWGVSNFAPEDAPLWCAFYDSLGKYGILNASAPDNKYLNYDIVRDLPTQCPSSQLIVVASSNASDNVHGSSGYGKKNVDLSAPGHNVRSTAFVIDPTLYGVFNGTSYATPHVTATIALLHAAACDSFNYFARSNPDSANLILRYCILSGVDTLQNHKELVASEGRLNVHKALLNLQKWCDGTLFEEPDTSFPIPSDKPKSFNLIQNPSFNTVTIKGDFENVENLKIYNTQGKQVLDKKSFTTDTNHTLFITTNLSPGVYIIQIETKNKEINTFKWINLN
jgi:serine protease